MSVGAPPETRAAAVKYSQEYSIEEAAVEFDVSTETIRRWRRERGLLNPGKTRKP